jgi:hypothetical protein
MNSSRSPQVIRLSISNKTKIKNILSDNINFSENYDDLSDECRIWLVKFLTHMLSLTDYEDWPHPDDHLPHEYIEIFLDDIYQHESAARYKEMVKAINADECYIRTFFYNGSYADVYNTAGVILKYYNYASSSTDPKYLIQLVVQQYLDDNVSYSKAACRPWLIKVLTEILLVFNNSDIFTKQYWPDLLLSYANDHKLYENIQIAHIDTMQCDLNEFLYTYYKDLHIVVTIVLQYSKFHGISTAHSAPINIDNIFTDF